MSMSVSSVWTIRGALLLNCRLLHAMTHTMRKSKDTTDNPTDSPITIPLPSPCEPV